jgi:hypothetical protein
MFFPPTSRPHHAAYRYRADGRFRWQGFGILNARTAFLVRVTLLRGAEGREHVGGLAVEGDEGQENGAIENDLPRRRGPVPALPLDRFGGAERDGEIAEELDETRRRRARSRGCGEAEAKMMRVSLSDVVEHETALGTRRGQQAVRPVDRVALGPEVGEVRPARALPKRQPVAPEADRRPPVRLSRHRAVGQRLQ